MFKIFVNFNNFSSLVFELKMFQYPQIKVFPRGEGKMFQYPQIVYDFEIETSSKWN